MHILLSPNKFYAHKVCLAVLCLGVILSLHGCEHKTVNVRKTTTTASPRKAVQMVGKLAEEKSFGHYKVHIYERNDADSSIEILKDGKQVYSDTSFRYWIGNPSREEAGMTGPDVPLPMGKDVNGDGISDLVIGEFTGGAHAYFYAYVFQIGDEFRMLTTFEGSDSEVYFNDLDSDGKYEVSLRDWTFRYWNACFANSPAPQVILRCTGGKYHLAGDLMEKSAIPADELNRRIERIRKDWPRGDSEGSEYPSALWGTMLDLIYTGHEAEAYKFFDAAWPPDAPDKSGFLKGFKQQLSTSLYWNEVEQMNRSDQSNAKWKVSRFR